MHVCRLWLRPQAAKSTSVKAGPDAKWDSGEAVWALPVHLQSIQILTLAVMDSDNVGADEIGRWASDFHEHMHLCLWIPDDIESRRRRVDMYMVGHGRSVTCMSPREIMCSHLDFSVSSTQRIQRLTCARFHKGMAGAQCCCSVCVGMTV